MLAEGDGPRQLTVLYDDTCRFCTRASQWLAREPAYVELRFVPAASPLARTLFPGLDPAATKSDLAVVADDGGVYRGANAWVMCLWALRNHRALAYTFSKPAAAPRARRFVAWVSEHRGWLGSLA